MNENSAFLTEYLTELNFLLTQEDHGNKLYDLLTPIKHYFLEDKELLSYSISRYCGASPRVAFFAQWHYQTLKLISNTSDLFAANQKHLRQKVPLKLRGVPNLFELVDKHINEVFLPHQIRFLNHKTQEQINMLVTKFPYLSKYLNNNYLSNFTSSQILNLKALYSENLSVNEFLKAQGKRESFSQIGFACLLGILFAFNQTENPVNPKAIKWVLIEEFLETISALHQIGVSKNLQQFIHFSRLDEKEQFSWWQKNEGTQLKLSLADPEAREEVHKIKQNLKSKAENNLNAMILPDKYTDVLTDLLHWGYQST